jgi:hypothetical protein
MTRAPEHDGPHAAGVRCGPTVAPHVHGSRAPESYAVRGHGTEDKLVDVIHARHTATIVPGAQLVLVDSHGHFSIEALVIPELVRVLETPPP